MAAVSSTELKTIITDPEGAETLVRVADQVGRQLKDSGLTTSQIRALFGEVRQIEAQWSMGNESRKTAGRRLILLKPKMAYRRAEPAAERSRNWFRCSIRRWTK